MAEDWPLFYHGAISKKDCEDLMGKKNKDGAYLIRDSETITGALCLCVLKKPVVYTYRILKTYSGRYSVMSSVGGDETYHKSLDDLVQNYKRKNQGLVTHLRHAIKRKTALMIQATTQSQSTRPVQRPVQRPEQRPGQRPEQRPDQRPKQRPEQRTEQRPEQRPGLLPERTEDLRRPSRPELNQTRAEGRRESEEEADYENLPVYVAVDPS